MPDNAGALREELVKLLQTHDWFYGYADDSRSYNEGKHDRARILELVKQVPDGEQLYRHYRPANSTY